MKNQSAVPPPGAAPCPPIDPCKILQSIVDVVCVLDEQGIFHYVSPSCSQLFGYSPEEMTGTSFLRFIHPDDAEKTVALALQGRYDHLGCHTSSFENRYYRKDGTLVPVIWSGRWDPDGLLYCVARDGAPKREVEQRLEKAQQMARVANFEYDIVNECYTHTSDTLFGIFGLDRAVHPRLTPDLLWSLVHPDDLPMVKDIFHKPIDRYNPTMEYRIIRPDGKVVYVHRLREVIRDAGGRPLKIIGALQDITDRKESELALRQSSERLCFLVQNGNDMVAILDAEGTYTFVGSNVEKLLGYRAEEMVGRNALAFIHPDDLPTAVAALHDIHHRDTLTLGPFRFKSRHGEWRWMETVISNHLHNPSIAGLIVNSRDVTDKKLKEDALRQSEQRFKALVLHGADLITIIDEEGNFVYISDNVLAVLGYSPEELAGQSALHYIHPEDAARVSSDISSLLQGNSKLQGLQYRFRHKDGSWRWLESKGRNHRDEESIKGILVNSRYVDDRIRLRDRLNRELMNKQKEITAAVIRAQEAERSQLGLELHDNVNQVLTTVKLYNEMYLSGFVTDRDLLHKSTQYVQDCINEIRSISRRLSAPTLGKISLKDSIGELIESINLSKRLEITYHPQGIDRCTVTDDLHLAIYRIVQEGLNNIIKYSGAPKASVALTLGVDELCLSIRDNGRGFDTLVKRQGIGITNMRTRAENQNASFRLVSAPGKGCAIEIRFPLDGEQPTDRSGSKAACVRMSGPPGSIFK